MFLTTPEVERRFVGEKDQLSSVVDDQKDIFDT
jgi:hypothetical protein